LLQKIVWHRVGPTLTLASVSLLLLANSAQHARVVV